MDMARNRNKASGPAEDDETGRFRRLFADARPLASDKVPVPKRRPPPKARFAREDERQVLRESLEAGIEVMEAHNGDGLRYRHPSVHPKTMRRLSRGAIRVQDETDLHGLTSAAAREVLAEFIGRAVARGHTCVRVVHGKGLRSGRDGPVLKRKVAEWLERCDRVLAFVSARQVDGGTGALYVLLRKV
jgi:DNA-nicking Smr family endonuclease